MQTSYQEPPFQFRIGHLLTAMAVICLAAAAGAQGGWTCGVYVGVLGASAVAIYFDRTRSLGAATASLILFLFLVAPPTRRQPSYGELACLGNLKQIGLALHVYHDDFGCFPPAYVADEFGQPIHSWRTLLLPYMEHAHVYRRIDLAEPWDSVKNAPLTAMPKNFFECPSARNAAANETNYVAVTGPGTVWQGASCTRRSDLRDGAANTIVAVEIVGAGIAWAEPRDLHILQLTDPLYAPGGVGPTGRHKCVINVLFADASVRSLPADIGLADFRAMLTMNGGEPAPAFRN
jgi:hypothetical protein